MEDNLAPIRVLMVEDHALVRMGLEAVIRKNSRVKVVAHAGTIKEAIQKVTANKPDLVLMDIRLPDGSGVEGCRQILSDYPDIRVLFLTSHSDDDSILAAVLAGAHGYLLKDIQPKELIRAIETVAAGHSIFDLSVTQRVRSWLKKHEESLNANPTMGLSSQQYKVLKLIAEGKTNKEIASALDLSEKTVKNYLATIFGKLQVSRRSEAAIFFLKNQSGETRLLL